MNSAAIRRLRDKLAQGQTTFGVWITLEAPTLTEIAVDFGLDWVVIDAEHGHLDWREIVEHLRVVQRSQTVALIRLAELNGGLIKRALDIGADGVVIPWIESPEQLQTAINWAKYPLEGMRGIGAERATGWGLRFQEHVAEANEHVLVVPIIETVRGHARIEDICRRVTGSDIFFIGPADLSASAGHAGQWEGPGVAPKVLDILATARKYGKQCGIVATSPQNSVERQAQGFRLIGLGMDTGLYIRGLRAMRGE